MVPPEQLVFPQTTHAAPGPLPSPGDLKGRIGDAQRDRLLTEKQLAAVLGCSARAIRKWRRQGMPVHRDGRRVLYRREDVLSWLAATPAALREWVTLLHRRKQTRAALGEVFGTNQGGALEREPEPAANPKRTAKLEAALACARLGWPVLPSHELLDGNCTCGAGRYCREPGNHPRRPLKVATTQEGLIAAWWDLWPDANVCIVTGARSGLLVLHVDHRHGGADQSLVELERQHGKLPKTPRAESGDEAFYYFEHRGVPIKNGVSIAPGIDVHGDGGHVLAPGSVDRAGHTCTWAVSPEEVPLASVPYWLLLLAIIDPRGARPPFPKLLRPREGS